MLWYSAGPPKLLVYVIESQYAPPCLKTYGDSVAAYETFDSAQLAGVAAQLSARVQRHDPVADVLVHPAFAVGVGLQNLVSEVPREGLRASGVGGAAARRLPLTRVPPSTGLMTLNKIRHAEPQLARFLRSSATFSASSILSSD